MSVSKLTGSVLFLALLATPRSGGASEAVYAVEVPEAEIVRVEISVPGPAFAFKGDPDEEVIEIDPDEITIDPDTARPSSLWELCRKAAADDRGDRLLCAMRVSDDSFQLVLDGSSQETSWTLAVEALGEADTVVGLYDGDGRRLAADDVGEGANFRIVEDLVPGSYFVRVEDRGGVGAPYVLRVTASRW